MIILNFAHPLTPDHLQQIEVLTGQAAAQVIEIDSQIDTLHALTPQVEVLIDRVNWSSTAWQTWPFVVNPPALNYLAVILLAELHGRCGYFPPVLSLRLVPESLPPRYEVAEIINLQTVRDKARTKRK